MSLSLPHPHPTQEGLQASSLLTPLHLLSPYGPWLADHAASFPWAQGAKNPRTLVASFWRGHPKGTRYWSSPALTLHTQQAQTPRLPGSSASVNPEILPGAQGNPGEKTGVYLPTTQQPWAHLPTASLTGIPPMFTSLRGLLLRPRPGCGPAAGRGGLTGATTNPPHPPGGHGHSWLLLLESFLLINLLQLR